MFKMLRNFAIEVRKFFQTAREAGAQMYTVEEIAEMMKPREGPLTEEQTRSREGTANFAKEMRFMFGDEDDRPVARHPLSI